MWSLDNEIILAAATYYIKNKTQNCDTLVERHNTEMPTQFYLGNDDSYLMHCGEIILTTKHIFVFVCSFCNNKYENLSNFSQHLLAEHFHDQEEKSSMPKEYERVTEVIEENKNQIESKIRIKKCNTSRALNDRDKTPKANTKQSTKNFQNKINSNLSVNEDPFVCDKIKEEPIVLDDQDKLIDQSSNQLPMEEADDNYGIREKKLDDEESLSSLEIRLDPKNFTNSLSIESLHKCHKCDRVFKKRGSLTIHLLSHSNVKNYQCNLCDVQFKYETNLLAHKRRHNGEKRFSCEICEKRFFTSSEAKRHERVHTGEKPYVCFKCGKGFRMCGELTEHMKRHDNIRPKNCYVCAKSFYNNCQLREHMAGHSGDRPFVCTYCPSSFARKKTLRQHIKLHLNAKEYVCKFCEKSFNQRPGLISHMNCHKSL